MKYQKKVNRMVENNEQYLYVKSAVLKYVHDKGINCSELVWKGATLQKKIKQLLDEAIIRARQNFRKTVMDRDL